MDDRNITSLKIVGGTKNKKLAMVAPLTDNKPALMEMQISMDKEIELYERSKIKHETDEVNEMENIHGNKSSTSSLKILKTVSVVSNMPVVVKKEIITFNAPAKVEKESSLQASTSTSTATKPSRSLNVENDETYFDNTGNQTVAHGNNKTIGNVIRLAAKGISDEERKVLRAKRFNTIVSESTENAPKVIKKTAANAVLETTATQTIPPSLTYDILKKRADRFGENVSTVMKSLDHKEKMLKRKLKFLESVTNSKELELKKRRAERFRMI